MSMGPIGTQRLHAAKFDEAKSGGWNKQGKELKVSHVRVLWQISTEFGSQQLNCLQKLAFCRGK